MEIRPFRGIRFGKDRVGDPARMISPPYDVIDEAQRKALQAQSEFNVVRVIRDDENKAGVGGGAPYAATGEMVRQWIAEGVLKADDHDSVYVYAQDFSAGGKRYTRLALIGAVKLMEYGQGMHAHERTLEGPKADRLNLMRQTKLNDGLIFVLYDDKNQRIDESLEAATRGAPLLDGEFDGVRHRLYAITDRAVHEQIAAVLADKPLFIADGHHRYETALNYMREHADNDLAQFRMMALVNFHAEGLVILPTHRLVHGTANFDAARLREALKADFNVDRLPNLATATARLDEAMSHARPAFVLYADKAFDLLTFKDVDAAVKSLDADRSEAWRKLDVPLLHGHVLRKHMGITEEAESKELNLHYIKHSEDAVPEAMARVDSGECQVLFLMNATRLAEMAEVAANGEKMPQKSTFFYPKVYTGLVLRSLEPQA